MDVNESIFPGPIICPITMNFRWIFFERLHCRRLATCGWVNGKMTQLKGDLTILFSQHFTSNSLLAFDGYVTSNNYLWHNSFFKIKLFILVILFYCVEAAKQSEINIFCNFYSLPQVFRISRQYYSLNIWYFDWSKVLS